MVLADCDTDSHFPVTDADCMDGWPGANHRSLAIGGKGLCVEVRPPVLRQYRDVPPDQICRITSIRRNARQLQRLGMISYVAESGDHRSLGRESQKEVKKIDRYQILWEHSNINLLSVQEGENSGEACGHRVGSNVLNMLVGVKFAAICEQPP